MNVNTFVGIMVYKTSKNRKAKDDEGKERRVHMSCIAIWEAAASPPSSS